MSNAFMKLHDYAVGNGIIDMAPDFARQLRSTTEMFLSLARKSSEGGRSESHDIESPGQESGASDKTPPAPNHKPSSPEVVGGQQPTTSEFGSHVLGYNLTTAAEMAIAPPFSLDDLTIPSTQPTSSKITATSHPLTGLDYEIISMPTFDNASFPFDISSDVTFPGFFNGTTATNVSGQPQPSSTTPTYTPPRISPYLSPSLPLPESLAFTEVTFGRRLQRTAIQTGYQLITMANPPKDLFAKIFGFCLLFEPVDKIRDRLGRSLDRTRNENLNYWGAPFWALGGMGQHGLGRAGGDVAGGGGGGGDAAEGCCGPVGNQGTEDVEKHGFNSDFSVGPFDAKTTGVRDRRLGPHMRITLPGFQGDFYDPEEVELYLQGKGVVIRPGQDYVTAEVDTSWFEEDGAAARDPWGDALSGSATIAVDGAGWGMGDAGGGVFGGVTASGDEAGWAAFTGGGAASANANRRKIVTLDVGAFIKGKLLGLTSPVGFDSGNLLTMPSCRDGALCRLPGTVPRVPVEGYQSRILGCDEE